MTIEMKSLEVIPCGLTGCANPAVGQCEYCGLPLCGNHANKVPDEEHEWYCRECFLFISVSGRLERPLARKVIPKVLVVDPGKCTGCRSCQLVCSYMFHGTYGYSGGAIRVRKFEPLCLNVPVVCEQCSDPECVRVCPTEALNKDPESGVIVFDSPECIGCMECVEVCPYGAIFPDPDGGKVVICNLCGGNPQCAIVCDTKALEWVNKFEAGERKSLTLYRNRPTIPNL